MNVDVWILGEMKWVSLLRGVRFCHRNILQETFEKYILYLKEILHKKQHGLESFGLKDLGSYFKTSRLKEFWKKFQ